MKANAQGTLRDLSLSNVRRKRSVQAGRRVNSVYSRVLPLTVAGDCSELPAELLWFVTRCVLYHINISIWSLGLAK